MSTLPKRTNRGLANCYAMCVDIMRAFDVDTIHGLTAVQLGHSYTDSCPVCCYVPRALKVRRLWTRCTAGTVPFSPGNGKNSMTLSLVNSQLRNGANCRKNVTSVVASRKIQS
eukprot:COSAG01_NODE_36410_length_518_cov_0.909308_1_plen_113_part_00